MTFDLTPTLTRALPAYRVRQSARARHVNLRIHPVDGLTVVVPKGFDERLIPDFIHAKRNWIEIQMARLAGMRGRAETWQRPTRIGLPAANEDWTVEYCGNRSTSVRVATRGDDALRVTGAVEDEARLRAALRRWLKRRAECLLPARLMELAGLHGFGFSRITIRHQRSRWGSCSSRGTISLNAKLMFVVPELVDHVLLHELCHTVHPNHSNEFHALLASLVPNLRKQHEALHDSWHSAPGWAQR